MGRSLSIWVKVHENTLCTKNEVLDSGFLHKFHLIRSFLSIWFSLLKKFLLENVISMCNEEWAIPNFCNDWNDDKNQIIFEVY